MFGKAKPDDFIFRDGFPMVILRPENVELALSLAHDWYEKWKGKNGGEECDKEFNAIIRAQPYQFVGYATKGQEIVNKYGVRIGKKQQGDSFSGSPQFEYPAFMTTGKFHSERWGKIKVYVFPDPTLHHDSNTAIVMDSRDPGYPRGSVILRKGSTGQIDCDPNSFLRVVGKTVQEIQELMDQSSES